MGDHKITWSVGWRNMSANSFNGWATPAFDKERQLPTVEISDLTAMARGANGTGETYESLFRHLWALLIDQIER
ncbi:MAG TPA: hypothetical protein VHO01_07855 [Jatrophihabitans sp.]|nr:hypothetical protein [Jatrophihabitans sp.]